MALWSVICANIKKKKGSFIGVFILMFIISVTITSILSAYLSGYERYDIASKAENAPDIINVIFEKDYDKTFENKLKLQQEVEEVENIKGMRYKRDLNINCKEFSSSILIFVYEPKTFSNKLENGDRMNIPKEGEIYLPKFFKEKYNCTIGDELTFASEDKEWTFTISDFFEDTTFGTSVMGRKRVYINPSDFEKLYDSNNKEFAHISALYTMLKDEYKGQGEVIKDINKATSIQKYGESGTVFAESKQYTFMMPDVLSAILLGFSCLLLIILMIVIAQSIASSIEMEYKTYGIFKAMGFSNIQLRIIILIEYIIASVAGMIIGAIVGGFIEDSVGEIILDGTGLFWVGGIKYKECIGVFIGILIILSFFILLFTRKITRISPVRAISFGNAPIHFSSRLNFSLGSLEFVPLSVKLGFKQVVTHIKQSVVLVFIICILTFFTVSMYSLGEILTGDTIEELFNPTGCDLLVYYS
ncbi:ABC-type transport system, involved in lipoprotein release, permease component, partial [Clostridium sp. DSM 8431]|uniref:FtsX-like permease family protein n=1 Tax=Clostridium sp. DSM 8431 TaxID=1761781 RepID=UPI0008F2DDCB